jgi:diacylglycerol kinase (ATP)
MLKKLRSSLNHSLSGLNLAFRFDLSVRIEFFVAILLLIALTALDVSCIRKILMSISVLLVICVELLNTAIERLADRLTADYDTQIKFVKDVASAAVLIAIIIAALIWFACIFY